MTQINGTTANFGAAGETTVSVTCPSNTWLVGGGATVSNTAAMVLTESLPNQSGTLQGNRWIVGVRTTQGSTFTVPYALCAS